MFDISLTVTDVPEISYGDFRYSIYKSIHPIVLMDSFEKEDLPLAHVRKREDISPDDILDIRYRYTNGARIELKDSIRANHFNKNSFRQAGRFLRHSCAGLLLTNIYNELGDPLFYRHNLGTTTYVDVSLQYEDGRSVPINLYKVISEGDSESSTHAAKDTVIAHSLLGKRCFVVYTNANGQRVRKLLNSSRLFTKDSLYSLGYQHSVNPNTSLLVYWCTDIGSEFEYSLPISSTNNTMDFKEGHSAYVYGYIPNRYLQNEPWFLCIDDVWIKGPTTDLRLLEIDKVAYTPYKPYHYQRGDYARIIDKHYLELDKYGILETYDIQSIEKFIEVKLYDKSTRLVKRAITNNPSKQDVFIDRDASVAWEYVQLSVSYEEGIIYSPEDLSDYDYAVIDYPCERKFYEFKGINLNPFHDPSLRGKTVVLYIKKTTKASSKSVYYLIYDEDLVITATDDSNVSVGGIFCRDDGLAIVNDLAPSNNGGAFSISLFVGSTFVDDYVYSNQVIVLVEISIPETLDENPWNVITDLRGEDFLSLIELRDLSTNLLVKQTYHKKPGVYSLDYLSGVNNMHINWTLVKDYVPTALYYADDILKRVQASFPAGTYCVISYDGVPQIDATLYDFATKTITLSWLPVVQNAYIIGGELYKQTSLDVSATLISTISNLSTTKNINIAFGSDDTLFFKLKTFVTINGQKYYGPITNILKFGF